MSTSAQEIILAENVVDGDENQKEINNKTVQFLSSIDDLLAYKPRTDHQQVTLHSYHNNLNLGGGEFVCVYSNDLIENGATVFKSTLQGYENLFWQRVNYTELTVEMAGAVGDKVTNDLNAFKKCVALGGSIKLRDNAHYLLIGDMTTHVGAVILSIVKPCKLYSDSRASVYFKHNVSTGSPASLKAYNPDGQLSSFCLENIDFFGHPNLGHANKVQRAWGVGLSGVDNYIIKNCRFSTFQGHNFNVSKRTFDNNGDWIQSSDLNNANTEEAVKRLLDMSSRNGLIENIKLDHCGSTGIVFFGGRDTTVKNIVADMQGSLYPYSVWTDDASSQTALRHYAINDNINIENVIGGDIRVDGCARAHITGCDVNNVHCRSYDFDQQKNNFNKTSHTYNPEDHLDKPFLFLNFLKRQVTFSNVTFTHAYIRSPYCSIINCDIHTTQDSDQLIYSDTNSIVWGDGESYYDTAISLGYNATLNVLDNRFHLHHNNCVCVGYGTSSANSWFNVLDSMIYKYLDPISFTHVKYSNNRLKRDRYLETSVYSGNESFLNLNHRVDFKQSITTWGIGSNYFKSLSNIRGGQGVQPIAKFSTSSNVVFLVTIVSATGITLVKRLVVSSDGGLTVTDITGGTTWNNIFTVTAESDSFILGVNISVDISIDMQATGTWGATVFKHIPTRANTTG